MARPRWTKKMLDEIWNRSDNPHSVGHCWHCGKTIHRDHRTTQDDAWHVDHYPVTFKDIEAQLCCGVTDAYELSNLVPSCRDCNISHKFERKNCFGRSQVPCLKTFWYRVFFFISYCSIFFFGFVIGNYLCVITGD